MARKVRIGDDGIDRLVETVAVIKRRTLTDRQEKLTEREAREIRARLFLAADLFDHEVAEVEQRWSAVPRTPDAPPLSEAWYANHAHALIDAIRRHIRSSLPTSLTAEQAAVFAFRLGALLMDAGWRLGRGEQVRRTINRVAKSHDSAHRPRDREPTEPGPTYRELDDRLRELLADGVPKTPSQLAREILGRTRDRRALDRLRKRIRTRLKNLGR